jgi:hypothetical protein
MCAWRTPQRLALVSLAEQRGLPADTDSRCHPAERSGLVVRAAAPKHAFERADDAGVHDTDMRGDDPSRVKSH